MKSRRPECFLFVVLVICCGGCRDETAEETAARIAKSPRLQKIQRVCDELPKPSFTNIGIKISGNANVSSLEYRYVSNTSVEAVADFYKNLPTGAGYILDGVFSTGGFSPVTEIRLHRDGVSIGMEHRARSTIFSIYCSHP